MKILLLTDIPPCRNFTAGLVLEQLCSFLPKGSVACYAIVERGLDPIVSTDLGWMPLQMAQKPQEYCRVLPGRLGGLASLLMESYNSLREIPKLCKKIVRFGQEFGADTLWCVLQGQTMIRLALPVARSLDVPLRSEVWDPPGWWLREKRVNRITAKRVLDAYQRVLRSSVTCATASWAMAEEYKREYGTLCVPFLPSLDVKLSVAPATGIHPESDYVIGMAGQTYATDEWNALILALDTVNWTILGRNVKILLLGRRATFTANGKAHIEFLGWRSQQDTIKILSGADVLYCPYWFDSTFETEARLSFPSKLTTYLASGRPVLFHGPRYASPARFLEQYGAGVCCYSLESADIIKKLKLLVSDETLYSQITQNGRMAFETHLTLSNLRNSFATFLQVDRSAVSSGEAL